MDSPNSSPIYSSGIPTAVTNKTAPNLARLKAASRSRVRKLAAASKWSWW
ncbi:hypothetical protein [Microcoleus sp. OTE_8_concoct_300]